MAPVEGVPEFLSSLLSSSLSSSFAARSDGRPHVTLTYAQSLDGCIAGVGGKQLMLSGKESMVMTHWLRTMHDGILVGIGTALNDDPQLNARHLPPREEPYPLPRPIILDTELRLPTTCKLIRNYQQNSGRQPWVVCSDVYSSGKRLRRETLVEAGARIVEVASGAHGVSLDGLLATLHSLGVSSLMVEGGQRIISSFLMHLDGAAHPVVDILIVTVAPTLVGPAGVGVLPPGSGAVPRLEHVRSAQFGRDTVVACRVCAPGGG